MTCEVIIAKDILTEFLQYQKHLTNNNISISILEPLVLDAEQLKKLIKFLENTKLTNIYINLFSIKNFLLKLM